MKNETKTLLEYVLDNHMDVVKDTVVTRKCPDDFGLRAGILCTGGVDELVCARCWARPFAVSTQQAELERAVLELKPLLRDAQFADIAENLETVLHAVEQGCKHG